MAKVIVLVDERPGDIAAAVRRLLGDGHEYEILAVAPDRRTPFLSEDTVRTAQADVERRYQTIARQAAEPVGATSRVRAGNIAAEAVAAAWEQRADIVAVDAQPPGPWSRLRRRRLVDYLLTGARCPVLLVPRSEALGPTGGGAESTGLTSSLEPPRPPGPAPFKRPPPPSLRRRRRAVTPPNA